jgi:hypothetical protein
MPLCDSYKKKPFDSKRRSTRSFRLRRYKQDCLPRLKQTWSKCTAPDTIEKHPLPRSLSKSFFNNLKPSGLFAYRQVEQSTILRSAHTMYLCVLCGSENKQPLFPYTALTDWVFITETDCVYCAVRTGFLNKIQVNFLLVAKYSFLSPLHVTSSHTLTLLPGFFSFSKRVPRAV